MEYAILSPNGEIDGSKGFFVMRIRLIPGRISKK
jgi:hypothetical protein